MRAYLDHNATSPPFPEVWERVETLRGQLLGNPSSAHEEGRRARRLLEQARVQVAALVGAEAPEVIFTSSGTEANAAALWGLVRELGGPAGVHVLLSAVEHPSLFAAAKALEGQGAMVGVLPVDQQGRLQLESLAELPEPCVVCVQLANQETGVLQEVAQVAARVRHPRRRFHCDAVQGAGKVPVGFAHWGVDTLALSGHKLGGLAGAGALVVRRGLELPALVPGEQEGRRRGGTEPLVAACAMGWACELLLARGGEWRRVAQLRDQLEERLLLQGLVEGILSRQTPRVPNTSCVVLPAPLSGQVVVAALDLAGVAVSSGPACSSGASQESAVVRAMGFGEQATRVIRVSLGLSTSQEEVEYFLRALARVCSREASQA